MLIHRTRTLISAAFLSVIVPTFALSESWKVVLTERHQEKLAELQNKPQHSALAVSERGAWARAWGKATSKIAVDDVLKNCRKHLKKGDLDCVVVAVDGKFIAASEVDVKRITQRYRAVSGKDAVKFFGVVDLSFKGNPDRAREQYELMKHDPEAWRSIPKSQKLKKALTKFGLVSNNATGWTIFLDKGKAVHASSQSKGNVLSSTFQHWEISQDGLLCLFLGSFDTGKPRSNSCMIIESAQNGVIRYNWASYSSGARMRKGFIVAGDPSVASVK